MTLKQFLTDGRLKPHRTSSREIRDLLRVVDRNLKDAAVREISFDLRFITAYQAALQLATVVLAGSEVRTTGTSHHYEAAELLKEARKFRGIVLSWLKEHHPELVSR